MFQTKFLMHITNEQRKAITQVAKKLGMNDSQFVRQAITEKLNRESYDSTKSRKQASRSSN